VADVVMVESKIGSGEGQEQLRRYTVAGWESKRVRGILAPSYAPDRDPAGLQPCTLLDS
jgi:hypothetical protein